MWKKAESDDQLINASCEVFWRIATTHVNELQKPKPVRQSHKVTVLNTCVDVRSWAETACIDDRQMHSEDFNASRNRSLYASLPSSLNIGDTKSCDRDGQSKSLKEPDRQEFHVWPNINQFQSWKASFSREVSSHGLDHRAWWRKNSRRACVNTSVSRNLYVIFDIPDAKLGTDWWTPPKAISRTLHHNHCIEDSWQDDRLLPWCSTSSSSPTQKVQYWKSEI